ncbi:hypothetical protein C9374_003825 [Naegleria lovaniensis]|uniref:ornithine decarboxylase n=1 Tax=Naegleria lovaniensis TaxID=51637 RepID=A0AA88H8A7_NAELO|nr:uncharacterized protein C9374_003825 [Naegleria lovaniensis]KAG2394061.1 hypothetical protein C9374_003825 [Naegleria lovaniensis]
MNSSSNNNRENHNGSDHQPGVPIVTVSNENTNAHSSNHSSRTSSPNTNAESSQQQSLLSTSSSTSSLGGMKRVKSIEFLHLGYEHHDPGEFVNSSLRRKKNQNSESMTRVVSHATLNSLPPHSETSSWVVSLQPLFENYFNAELHSIKDQQTHLNNTVRRIVKKITEKKQPLESFFVVDLSHIVRQIERWKKAMTFTTHGPCVANYGGMVRPMYAVKCNPNENIIKIVYLMGGGFDCASQQEISCQHAGVEWTTLDSVCEVEKLAEHWKHCKGIIRIKTDDAHSAIGFSEKFGATKHGAIEIMERAKELGINLVGVSFHVGTNCEDVQSYVKALRDTAELCKTAKDHFGFTFNLIDIGGGFMSRLKSALPMETVANEIIPLITESFARSEITSQNDLVDRSTVRIIAEPGRYVVSRSHTLVCHIHTKKDLREENAIRVAELLQQGVDVDSLPLLDDFHYYIDDGIYGSFNNVVYDHVQLVVNTVMTKKANKNQEKHPSTLWGTTCDSLDILFKGYPLPELSLGDHLFFHNFGAYTTASSSEFNGFKNNRLHYIWRN